MNDFVDSVAQELECPICFSTIEHCALLNPCAHIFCSQCIDQAFSNGRRICPICRQTTTSVLNCFAVNSIANEVKQAKSDMVKAVIHTGNTNDILDKAFEELKEKLMSPFQHMLQDLVKLRDVKLEKEPENKTEILKEHDKAVFCLLEGFKKSINRAVNVGLLLPRDVCIEVPSKGITNEHIKLFTNTTLQDVIDHIAEIQLARKDKLLKTKDVCATWNGLDGEKVTLDANSGTFHSFGVPENATISITGTFVCVSDLPPTCICKNFVRGKKYNFYKWICEPCIKVCHATHQVELYVTDEIPTRACCRCGKKHCTFN